LRKRINLCHEELVLLSNRQNVAGAMVMKCEVCGQPFTEGQYVYEIKLDDGKIIVSHGYPCCDKVKIERVPLKGDDWWIRARALVEGVE